jgi:poly(ADP-ribose) glycohydrolase ARH3
VELRDRYRGCLLGLALGDALGAPFEGFPPIGNPADIAGRLPVTLRYTDDTEMAMGLAESLAGRGRVDPEDMARRFVANFDPSRGYGPGTVAVLGLIGKGTPWEEANRSVFPEGSMGNGAAMRAAPIGLCRFPDAQSLRRAAFLASAVTHDNPVAKEAALLIAGAVAHLVRGGEPAALPGVLEGLVSLPPYREKLGAIRRLLARPDPPVEEVVSILGHGVLAVESAPTALYAFLRSGGSYKETVLYAISLGGDTDTIAAMAGALSGTLNGSGGLPEEYLRRLEDRERLRELADLLFERFARGGGRTR